jgi:hypothetical protein
MKRALLSAAIAVILFTNIPILAQEGHDTTNSKEGMIRGSVGIGMAAPGGSYLIVLPTDMPWMDTGIGVGAGYTVKITAAPSKNHPPCDGAAGCPPYREADAVITGGALGNGLAALVGRVGDNGVPFSIGTRYEGLAANPGSLYVGYNDCWGCWADNTGAFELTITVKKK